MTARGIGAAVVRKEDQRFMTGKGRYVDDINRPGQTHARFLRRTRRTRGSQASTGRGRRRFRACWRILRAGRRGSGLGNLACAWQVKSKTARR